MCTASKLSYFFSTKEKGTLWYPLQPGNHFEFVISLARQVSFAGTHSLTHNQSSCTISSIAQQTKYITPLKQKTVHIRILCTLSHPHYLFHILQSSCFTFILVIKNPYRNIHCLVVLLTPLISFLPHHHRRFFFSFVATLSPSQTILPNFLYSEISPRTWKVIEKSVQNITFFCGRRRE